MLKAVFPISSLVAAGVWSAILPASGQVNVTQFHNHSSRDGLYIDSAFTPSAATNLTRDLTFDGTIEGSVFAQPLYIEGGPNGPMVIAATESNNVYALDAVDGSIIWWRNVGPPVPLADLECPPKFDPMGITGTPVVDLASLDGTAYRMGKDPLRVEYLRHLILSVLWGPIDHDRPI